MRPAGKLSLARRTRRATLACSALLASALAAHAADFMPPAEPPAAPVPAPTPVFSWDRSYVGAYAGVWIGDGFKAGIVAGHNFLLGSRFLIGAEVAVGLWMDPGINWEWLAVARAGVVLGDRVMIYGGVGANAPNFGAPASLILTNGAEFAIGTNLTLRAESIFYQPGDGSGIDSASIGVSWYFGD